ncbi:MAG: LD-carboxypeptidase [Proteobacteria bacterium]|nr:LD-carboxypeptidase [Pseudomonadota bacterium]MBU1740007.1 LD-carboxypeptidase [Pseudomonadota bacterium]
MAPRIAIAAPSSAFSPEKFEAGLTIVRNMGLSVRVDEAVRARDGFLAGDDALRAAHLRSLLQDDSVDFIWCARGGFGAARTLSLVDDELIRTGQKTLLGFSDATVLLGRWSSLGGPAWHGPVVTQVPDLDEESLTALIDLLRGRETPKSFMGTGLIAGRAEGVLLGGNLASLASVVGTPIEPDLSGTILLLEEVNEAPYRIDRMLTQLELSGRLPKIAGAAVGHFVDCGEEAAVEAVLKRRLGTLGAPVVRGLPFGHGSVNWPVRLGSRAVLDGGAGTLELLG